MWNICTFYHLSEVYFHSQETLLENSSSILFVGWFCQNKVHIPQYWEGMCRLGLSYMAAFFPLLPYTRLLDTSVQSKTRLPAVYFSTCVRRESSMRPCEGGCLPLRRHEFLNCPIHTSLFYCFVWRFAWRVGVSNVVEIHPFTVKYRWNTFQSHKKSS